MLGHPWHCWMTDPRHSRNYDKIPKRPLLLVHSMETKTEPVWNWHSYISMHLGHTLLKFESDVQPIYLIMKVTYSKNPEGAPLVAKIGEIPIPIVPVALHPKRNCKRG